MSTARKEQGQDAVITNSNDLAPAGIAGDKTHSLLRIIRAAQPISRADLARRLDVSRGTITEIVKPLIAAGLVHEGSPEPVGLGRLGRPPLGLTLRARRTMLAGVSIGVGTTQVGAATPDGQMLGEESFDTPTGPSVALERIRASLARFRAATPERKLAFVGVSVPGPTDAKRSRLLYSPHLGWRDVPIAAGLGSQLPNSGTEPQVIVENNATAAAAYEARRRLRHYSGGAWKDFALVRAGTGIGVGLVLGGEVYRGIGPAGGFAGEFGHMTIVARGRLCPCGNRGCWERYASAASAATTYTGHQTAEDGKGGVQFKEIVARAEEGEPRARLVLRRLGEYLGIGIANVIGGLGVPRVVVGGRVVHGWKFIEEPLREAVARTMAGRLTRWTIERGEATGSELGGALEVAFEQYLLAVAARTKAAA